MGGLNVGGEEGYREVMGTSFWGGVFFWEGGWNVKGRIPKQGQGVF